MNGIHSLTGMDLKPSLLQFDSLESLPLPTAGEEQWLQLDLYQ